MFKRFGLVVLGLLVWASPALAQVDGAVATVKQHFVSNQARYGVSTQDLSDLVVSDAYTSRRTGATYVYLNQSYNGIAIVNSRAQAAISHQGAIVSPSADLLSNVASRINGESAAISIDAAADAASSHLARSISPTVSEVLVATDEPGEIIGSSFDADSFFPTQDRSRLVYYASESGSIDLAWEIEMDSRMGYMWLVYISAVSGSELATISLTNSETWGSHSGAHSAVQNLAPLQATSINMAAASSGTYNVFAVPVESPIHGSQSTVVNPHDATASPNGWHDTGSNTYTYTRGNNVFAYEDRDDTEMPSGNTFPDGGGSLIFDFPFDPLGSPLANVDLAVTNLFYWNNIVHDVMYQYGFDEASGNFQTNNFGNGGNGNDAVNAEAQSGAESCTDAGGDPTQCTNNANFSTPSDGGAGRMQMYEWAAAPHMEITAPAEIAGEFDTGYSTFGDPGQVIAEAVVVYTLDVEASRGCTEVDFGTDVTGKIAFVQRGDCSFLDKAQAAQAVGASAIVIYNCVPGSTGCSTNSPGNVILNMVYDPVADTDDVTIPAAFVTQATGEAVDGASGTVMMDLEAIPFRDSDLDSGIIVHEYGHGISNRLTGGPGAAGCLVNAEQAGEGWSDYFGLMLTQKVGDAATDPRGVGPYVEFQDPDGIGIRPAPYSTNMAINGFTYDDTRTAGLSVPHGIGFVFATMLWEMTWDLIAAHGYDADIYDAAGSAGNQIALQLVTEGLRLQPCSPGFVDARDAILEADEMLYGGANTDIIWQAFARRGLGLNADQGSSGSNADNFGDFTFPISNEAGSDLPESHTLSQAYPNPFNPQAQFTLQLNQAQDVRIEVIDALGRSVALLHDGQLASGIAHQFTIDGTNLASGIYTYRVIGETFNSARRVTLLK